MSFGDAIRDGFAKYVTFSGRSSRAAYWWWYLFNIILVIVAFAIDSVLGTAFIVFIAALAVLLPNLAVLVRRLHDAGHSGWWILIGLLPVVGTIVLLVFTLQGSEPPNQWGAGPDTDAARPAPAI